MKDDAEARLNRELRRAEEQATRLWLEAKRFFESRKSDDDTTHVWTTPTEEQKKFDAEEHARIERIDALLSK